MGCDSFKYESLIAIFEKSQKFCCLLRESSISRVDRLTHTHFNSKHLCILKMFQKHRQTAIVIQCWLHTVGNLQGLMVLQMKMCLI